MSIFDLTFSISLDCMISLLSRRRLSKNESNETIFFLDYSYVSVTIVVVHLVLYRYLYIILLSRLIVCLWFRCFRYLPIGNEENELFVYYNIILSCTMDSEEGSRKIDKYRTIHFQ